MTDHVYKKIEVVGSSTDSIEDAASNAVKEAAKSIHNLRWMEVSEIRGHIENNEIHHWQVGVKLGFTLEQKGAPETQPDG